MEAFAKKQFIEKLNVDLRLGYLGVTDKFFGFIQANATLNNPFENC